VNPNLDQWLGLVRTLLAGGGPLAGLLIAYGMPADKVNMWLALGVAIVPMIIAGVWSWVIKTDSAKVTSVGAMPGVTVAVGPTASAGAQSVAADPAVPGVKVAA